jgi:protein gp37
MKNSGISWTHHTFNPWIGCTKISDGCDNCYAERDWDHKKGLVAWGSGKPRHRTGPANWQQPIRWDDACRRQGIRQRVFCASLADVFDPEVPDAWREDLFTLIKRTPNLDWLLLTKRVGLMAAFFRDFRDAQWPWPHVSLGTSIEIQGFNWRGTMLAAIPAARRFVSIEPMLNVVDIREYASSIQEVIVGGESGPHARLCPHPLAVREVRDQCMALGVRFCFKQWGDGFPWKTKLHNDAILAAGYDPTLPRGGRMLDSTIWVGEMRETASSELLKALHLDGGAR